MKVRLDCRDVILLAPLFESKKYIFASRDDSVVTTISFASKRLPSVLTATFPVDGLRRSGYARRYIGQSSAPFLRFFSQPRRAHHESLTKPCKRGGGAGCRVPVRHTPPASLRSRTSTPHISTQSPRPPRWFCVGCLWAFCFFLGVLFFWCFWLG